jgi:cytochrome bd-type quinol oxidase subunit 1
VIYWAMRVMAFAGVLMFLVAALGAWLYWRKKLERARWFQWTALVAIALPYRGDRRLDPSPRWGASPGSSEP